MTKEEKEYLENYNIADYERPSVAADIAIFSIMKDKEKENYRKPDTKALKILLIKRASYPFKDCWALPGGFCRPDEDVLETAKRELYEETNVKNAYLKLAGVFGEKGRDPRGWIISNTFLALMDGEKCTLNAGTDAWEAKWFSVTVLHEEIKRKTDEDSVEIEVVHSLKFVHEESGESFFAVVNECKVFKDYHETKEYKILESGNIGFDHAKIILYALEKLRADTENDLKMVFDLMPEMFTLTELQNACELILGYSVAAANFRRKISDYVAATDCVIEGNGYRPAKLFKRNIGNFYT